MILSRLEKRTRVRSLIVVSPGRVPPLPAIGRKLSFSIENSISLMHSGEVSTTEWLCWSFYRANSCVILPSSIHRESFPVIIDEPGKGDGVSEIPRNPAIKNRPNICHGKYTLVDITRGYYPAPVNMIMPPSPRINNRKSTETFPQTIPSGDIIEGNLTDSGRCFYSG